MRRAFIFGAVFALALAACSPDSIAENIIEGQEGVGNVDIDSDDGEVSIETDDGSATFGGGEIPDGFPVDVPNGGEVLAVMESEDFQSVNLTFSGGDYDDLVEFYENWIAGSGLTEVAKTEISSPPSVGWTLQDETRTITISIAEGGGDAFAVQIVVADS